jgi:hypothetical protein
MKKIAEMKSPGGNISFHVTWDSSTGEIRVGNELAGYADTEKKALVKADYYVTTCQTMKD